MRTQQLAARGLLAVVVALLLLLALASLSGCMNKSGQHIAEAQKPGIATGAGATLTGPANSATPTTQVAQRRIAFYAPPAAPSVRVESPQVKVESSIPVIDTTAPQPSGSQLSTLSSQLLVPPAPAWIDERTETSLGQHQDAAGLIKAANALGSWGRARWLGIVCMIFSAFALAWAHNNPDGYPLVAWKTGAVGLFLALFDPSPWWLLLLLIPAGFYVVQKLKITLPP